MTRFAASAVLALSMLLACSGSRKNARNNPPPNTAENPPPQKQPQQPTAQEPNQVAQANAQMLSDRSVQLAGKLGTEMNGLEKKLRVSVLPFTDNDGRVCPLGQYVSEKIVTGLPRSAHYELVERSRLDQVMRDLKVETSSMISDETVASLGNMLGADALIIGTFTDLGATIDLNCRIVEPETGLIIATANTQLLRGPAVDRLWANRGPNAPPQSPANAGNRPNDPRNPPNANDPNSPAVRIGLLLSQIPLENSVNRPGNDYKNFALDEPRPRKCQRACAEDEQCKAFSYVRPGLQGPRAHCWLKTKVGRPITQPGMISGIRTEMLSAAGQGRVAANNPAIIARPLVANRPLALCLNQGKECGQPAANLWCQRNGFSRAIHFTVVADIGDRTPTQRIGDNGICNKPGCDGISSIICAR